MAKQAMRTKPKQSEKQEALKRFQGEQGSGGSYGTGGGFEDDGASVPEDGGDQNLSAQQVRSSAAKDRPAVQGDFGPDVGPDGKPVEGPPQKHGDAQHGYSQDSGYAQSGGTKQPEPTKK